MSVVAVKFDLIAKTTESYAEALAAWLRDMGEAPVPALLVAMMPDGTVRMRVEASSPFKQPGGARPSRPHAPHGACPYQRRRVRCSRTLPGRKCPHPARKAVHVSSLKRRDHHHGQRVHRFTGCRSRRIPSAGATGS